MSAIHLAILRLLHSIGTAIESNGRYQYYANGRWRREHRMATEAPLWAKMNAMRKALIKRQQAQRRPTKHLSNISTFSPMKWPTLSPKPFKVWSMKPHACAYLCGWVCVCVDVCVSVCLSVCVGIYLCASVFVCLCLCVPVCACVSVSLSLSLCVTVCIWVCLCVPMSILAHVCLCRAVCMHPCVFQPKKAPSPTHWLAQTPSQSKADGKADDLSFAAAKAAWSSRKKDDLPASARR